MLRQVSLEVALYLARSAGAAVYTGSRAHWQQLRSHTSAASTHVSSLATEFADALSSVEDLTEINQQITLELRQSGKLDYARCCLRRM